MQAIESADIGIVGEGEEAICELADCLNEDKPLEDIAGLVIRKGNIITETANRNYVRDINDRPFPDREGFDYSYFIQQSYYEPFFGIFASRSCAFNCSFCYHYEPYRQRSLDSIFEELDAIMIEYNSPSFIHFYDELFSVKKDRILEFCNRIKPYKISYELYMRVTDINYENVMALKESGCKTIGIGLESYSETILKSMNKRILPKDIDNALKILSECEVGFMGNFILGDLEDTEETVNESLAYRDSNPQYNINIYMIRTLPGSTIYKKALEKGLITDEVAFLRADCPYINNSKLSDKTWNELFDKTVEEGIYLSKYLTDFELEIISTNSGNGYGEAIYTMICPNCQKKTQLKTSLFRYTSKATCKHCNSRWDLDPIRYFKTWDYNVADDVQNGKCVIWGCNALTYHMLQRYPDFKQNNTIVVDSNTEYLKRRLFGKVVEAPNVLADGDILIIAAIGSRQKIIRQIKKQSIQISKILYPAVKKYKGEYYIYLHECTESEIALS